MNTAVFNGGDSLGVALRDAVLGVRQFFLRAWLWLMSGLGNTAQTDLLSLVFENVNWANLGDATGVRGSSTAGSLYVALHTADPTNAGGQSSSEATYTGYGRVAIARAAGSFDITGTSPTQIANHSATTFAPCTGGSNTITHFSVGRDSGAGAGEIVVSGPLTASLVVSNGITPSFAAGALAVTAD